MPSSKSTLPAREANVFKQVVRLYEGKNFKKAIKSADSILKKYPDHGETLAMKGLAFNSLDRKAEARELVKRGLKLDMLSHICWHVYGLLHRSDRNYREAAKAYLNALRFDKDNQQILRDLSLLQIQIRDYEGLEDTRRKLLSIRPNNKDNWIGFALAFHLLGNYNTAVSVIDTYQDMPKGSEEEDENPLKKAYELSELNLYKNLMLEESGAYESALKHLNDNETAIVDFLGLQETRARLFSRLGKHDECAEQLHSLLEFNADNVAYHQGLVNIAILSARAERGESCCNADNSCAVEKRPSQRNDFRKRVAVDVQISGKADVDVALSTLDELTTKYPRNRVSARLALDILPSGDHPQFIARLDSYVRPFLTRGIASLFSDLKTFYSDNTKADAAGRLFENYKESLVSAVAALPPRLLPEKEEDEKKNENAVEKKDSKTENTLLWVYHYLAQHYDRIGMLAKALELVELAIEKDPAVKECYLVKARILKHCGDTIGAMNLMDKVRQMELSDRYLNTKCTKYGLRADKVAEAEAWIGLFTRDAENCGIQALYEMQSIWFELESAESHMRCGELSKALKKFTAVDRHFADIIEDQFDFHNYCLRKVTLRAYVSLLRFEDSIRGHDYYERAAVGLIKVLLQIADLPAHEKYVYSGEHSDIQGFATMTEAEQKKAISKKKKRQAKEKSKGGQGNTSGAAPKKGGKAKKSGAKGSGKKPTEAKANGTNKTETKANGTSNNAPEKPQGFMDVDPDGSGLVKTLLESKDVGPLEKALGYVRELETHRSDKLVTHLLAFEIASRRGRWLQALRAVKRAQKIDKDDPGTVAITIRLGLEMRNGGCEGLSDIARAFFDAEGDVMEGRKPAEYLEEYTERTHTHAKCRIGVALAQMQLTKMKGVEEIGTTDAACERLVKAIRGMDVEGTGPNVMRAQECKKIVEEMRMSKIERKYVERVVVAYREKHKMATCFGSG